MLFIRSLLFNLLFCALTILIGVAALPALVSRRLSNAVSRFWMGCIFFLLRSMCGVHVRVEGKEHIPNHPVIFASKHQSAWETLYLWRMFDNPAFILKKQLLQIPVFGWYLWRSGPIAIDRKAGKQAMQQVIDQGKKRLEAGRHVVIFPEGTRTKPGSTKPYKKGVMALHEATAATVVPVAHNAGLCWPRNSFFKYPGTIILRFLPPLKDAGLSIEALQETIEKESIALL